MGTESCNTGTGDLGQPLITGICDDSEQLIDTPASDWGDYAKLGKMRTDRIDDGGLLANEQMPGAMKRQATLLLRRLGLHEPHGPAGQRLRRLPLRRQHRSSAASRRASRRPAASCERCGRAPAVRVTSNGTWRKPRCRPGTAAASGRTTERTDASADDE